jgi:hypothetical protein
MRGDRPGFTPSIGAVAVARAGTDVGAVKAPSCSSCGLAYSDAAWAKLALSHRIEPTEVRLLVSDWPDEICIEVRSCLRCARLVAAKRRLRRAVEAQDGELP